MEHATRPRKDGRTQPNAPAPPPRGNKPGFAGSLQDSWLLRGTRQKFLDAFLAAAKIEHIMPKVEIVGEGDQVNEVRG
jgi:hypothetical protein